MTDDTVWTAIEDEGFFRLIGPVYQTGVGGGRGRFRFLADERHHNSARFVHGGMLMAFADRGLSRTARQNDTTRLQATLQLDVHFIAPARIGEMVEMDCYVIRQTLSLFFVDGTMLVKGETVATARGVWKIISK